MYRIVLDYKQGMWVVQLRLWGLFWASVRETAPAPAGTPSGAHYKPAARTFDTYMKAKQWTREKGFDEAYVELCKSTWTEARRDAYR